MFNDSATSFIMGDTITDDWIVKLQEKLVDSLGFFSEAANRIVRVFRTVRSHLMQVNKGELFLT